MSISTKPDTDKAHGSNTPTDNHRVSDLLTITQASTAYGLTYWQLDRAEKTGRVESVRLEEGGRRLLVRSSVERFVKMRAQKKKARLLDTPSDKDKSTARRAGKGSA